MLRCVFRKKIFDFLVFSFWPKASIYVFITYLKFCTSYIVLSLGRIVSSTNCWYMIRHSFYFSNSFYFHFCRRLFYFSLECLTHKKGEKWSPCLSPLDILKIPLGEPLMRGKNLGVEIQLKMRFIHLCKNPKDFRDLHRNI